MKWMFKLILKKSRNSKHRFNPNIKLVLLSAILFLSIQPAFGMHISEGFLSPKWCLVWYVLSIPFVVAGYISIKKKTTNNAKLKLILGISGAFMFVLSALKLPSVTGSCSHLTGTGLGTIIFGPWAMAVLGLIVLLFQALLLAHGGITTLGANVFSMAIAGPLVAYGLFWLIKRFKINISVAVFAAAFAADLFTYLVTSAQLALSFPDMQGGFCVSFEKFGTLFALTQLPLAIVEGIITVLAYNAIKKYAGEALEPAQTKETI